ncbi:cytochrome P450 [Kitasatospora sp. NPDC051853]|uniref:cytochrome P450 n=1 Tax=Kitasatospora sp. NPDC051853 TaxID=3364058 RepID=UPI00378CDFE8
MNETLATADVPSPAVPPDPVTADAAFPIPVPPADPPCAYARLRAERPVVLGRLPNGETGWLVTRHQDARAAFADPRLTRPLLSAWPPRDGPGAPPPCPPTFLEMTGEHHERVRRTVQPLFTRARLARDAPRIRATAGALVDAMTAGGRREADLVAEFAEPFPLRVLCDTTGLPYEERERYLPHTLTLLSAAGLGTDEILAALYALLDYAEDLVRRRERDPGEDHVSLLLAESRRPGGGVTRDDVLSFVVTMLMAGYKTNIQHTANALLLLLTHPEQLRRLREDLSGTGTAVEELLRYVPLMNAINVLVALEDHSLQGQPIRAGDAVLPVIASANRDAAVFDGPDRLDLTRTPNPHLAFGHGPHYCTGAQLTRLQLTIAVQVLTERLPGLELAAPAESLDWDETTPLRAPARLPVRW